MKRYCNYLIGYVIVFAALAGIVQGMEKSNSNKIEPIWSPGEVPGAKGNQDKDKPTLTICLPDKETSNGMGIVICPGGGYGFAAEDGA